MSAVPAAPSCADLASIASDVWACAVPEGALVGSDAPLPSAVGAVAITGAWRGWVTLELPVATAARVTAAMLQLEGREPGREDVEDALGELANMIGGNVKSLVPAPSTLGLPVVVGDAREVVSSGREVCRAELSRDDARLCVRVWQAAGDLTTNIEGRDAS